MNRGRRSANVFCLLAVWFNTVAMCADEPPQLDYLFPAGGQQGTTVELEIGGYLDPWPVEVWTDCPGLKFEVVKDAFVHTATETESSPGILLYERKGIGKLVVEIDEDAPIGRHLVRVYTPYGTSAPMPFVIGHRQEQSDQEPNDIVDRAQLISQLPVTINGRLWGDHARQVLSRDRLTGRVHFRTDTDTYAITLETGQWLIASTEAYALGYAIDTVLDLREANGAKLAHNNDVHFSTYDSFLAYRAEKSGTYFLQVFAFHLQRPTSNQKPDLLLRDSAVYRLTLSHGPHAQYTYPASVRRGEKTHLQVYGINLPSPTGVLIHEFDLSGHHAVDDHVLMTTPKFENRLRLEVGDGEAIQEIEPNDQRDVAQTVSMPVDAHGRIDRPGDKDYFAFTAEKEQQFTFLLSSPKSGYPLLGVLKIEDTKGEQLAALGTGDMGLNATTDSDPRLTWKAPDDGLFYLRVSELTTHSGPEYIYRIHMDSGHHFSPTVPANMFRVQPGKSQEVKFSINRHNHKLPLNILVESLPEGVSFSTSQMPIQGNEAAVMLTAAPNAKPSNQPVKFRFFASEQPDQIRDATASVHGMKINFLRAPETDATHLVVAHTPHIWLTVTPRQLPEPDRVLKK